MSKSLEGRIALVTGASPPEHFREKMRPREKE